MQIEVKIDQDAVQQQLVQAITDSAIGAAIQAAISKALTSTGHNYNDRRTIVERAVDEALHQEIRRACVDALEARRAEIKQQITDKLTDEALRSMTDAAWAVMDGRMKAAG